MLAKVESGKTKGGDPGNGKLLHDIETISDGIYLSRTPSKGLITNSDVRSKSVGKPHFPDPKLKPRLINEDSSQKDKKSSIWSWKPLKALSHIRNRRLNCCFSLQVHSIEGLPSNFNDTSLCVQWRRKDGGLQTRPARAFKGIAEFEETLMHRCSIFVSGNGPHHTVKYEAKQFLLYAYVVGASNLDLGEYRIDLTRLLPLTLEELEEDKNTGKWTTSFKLSGKANGAILNVSFGFLVVRSALVGSGICKNAPQVLSSKQSRLSTTKLMTDFGPGDGGSTFSCVGNTNRRSRRSSQSVEDVKILHEVLPSSSSDLSSSVNLPYQKLDESKLSTSVNNKPEFDVLSEYVEPLKKEPDSFLDSAEVNTEKDCEQTTSTVIEQGTEFAMKEHYKMEEGANKNANDCVAEHIGTYKIKKGNDLALEGDSKYQPCDAYEYEFEGGDCKSKESKTCTKVSVMEELESALHRLSILELAGQDSPQAEDDFLEQENYMEIKSSYKAGKLGKSLSLDDVAESVASEFLNMLGIEHSPFSLSSDSDPESPREKLLRQFEKDFLAGGNCIFNFDISKEDQVKSIHDSPNVSGSSVIQAAEVEHQIGTQVSSSKTRAKMLEDLEAKTLMREWGLNEKVFLNSPPDRTGGFGSPIDLPPEEPLELPPLGEGLGPFIQTKDGGFLRSINPSLFRNAKNNGSLIMQVSSSVVVPAEMGSGIVEILQCLASVGIEKLSMQVNKIMPLEDITGKMIQEVALEDAHGLEAPERQGFLHRGRFEQNAFDSRNNGKGASSGHRSNISNSRGCGEIDSEYVSLEDLAPLAMDKIEALSIEGLRIQSGMSDEEAPSNISSQSVGKLSALKGKKDISGSLGFDGAVGLQLLDIKDNGDDVDGLMGLSLTLDEWMKLDAGIVDDENQISERTSKILAAHHANRCDLIGGGLKGDSRRGRGSGGKCGLLGSNFTVALMVQLRDPLRNYDPVGAPMLALIQVERVFVPQKPKIYSLVSERQNGSEEDDESEQMVKEEMKDDEERIPQFKVTEVHVAGLKTEPGKKKLWGTAAQQQSGSRWLIASGMGKNKKHPFMKSKAVVAKSSPQMTTTVQPGNTLWSISSRVHGTSVNRNPNIIFPNETIRLN